MSSELKPLQAEDKSAVLGQKSWWARTRLRTWIVVFSVAAFIVVALAIGLGVGLTLRNRSGEGASASGTARPSPTTRPGEIWQPAVADSWQIVLLNPLRLEQSATSVDPDVSIYDIDLFNTERATIDKLHSLNKRVICYFSAGTFEDWRPDARQFNSQDLGSDLDEWEGERWLNVRSQGVRDIMRRRIQMAADKGCDAVDPDNVDGYGNDNGLGLTQDDAIDFVRFLSSEASSRRLSIGLKNAGAIVPSVLSMVQFSVNEQCVQYRECSVYAPFIAAQKPVFHIEYPDGAPSIQSNTRQRLCSNDGDARGSQGFSTVIKKMNLDGWVEYCDGNTAQTATR